MGLAGLDQALSGIRVAQQQLSVLSNNISNAQVEGFTRKILPQSTLTLNGQGAGVLSDTIIRKVDTNLQLDLFRQTSIESFLTTQVDALDRIQQFHGPPSGEASFSALLGQLRDDFLQLDNDPGDPLLQNQALSSAKTFASKIRDFASLVQEIRNDAEGDIASSVDQINGLLQQIADLNAQIKFNNAVDSSVAQLSDQRDQAITALSELIEISSFTRGDGVFVVQTKDGQQLAAETATEVFFQQSNIGPENFHPDSINGIFVGGNPAQNAGAFDITDTEPGGKIGALVDLRDNILPRFQAQIDELAANVADRFDRQGLRLFTNEGGGLPDFTIDPDNTADLSQAFTPTAANVITATGVVIDGTPDEIDFNVNIPGVGSQTLTIDLDALDGTGSRTQDVNGIAYLLNQEIQNNPNISAQDFNVSTGSGGALVINSEYGYTVDAAGSANPPPANTLVNLGIETDGDDVESFSLPFTGPSTAVDYVGFAQEFQVNPIVDNDSSLIQRGTITREDGAVQPGSNEVIRRIIAFTFGDTEFQQADSVSLSDPGTGGGPATPIQEQLQIFAQNRVEGSVDLREVGNLFTSPDSPLVDPATAPGPQEFNINFTDPTSGLDFNVTIDLNDLNNDGILNGVPSPGADTQDLDGLVNLINARIDDEFTTAFGVPQTPENRDISATQSGGNLVINSNFDFEVATTGGTAPGAPNPANPAPSGTLFFLGLNSETDNNETFIATQPYFDIAVGDNEFTRISIDPTDTIRTLQDKLNLNFGASPNEGVPDLLAQIVTDIGDQADPADDVSFLNLRPGQEASGPDNDGDGLDDVAGFGGELRMIGGPFETSNVNNDPILVALFGSENPVENVSHRSFRETLLGPNVDIDTQVKGVETLLSYSQNAVNNQTNESILKEAALEDESTFKETLKRQFQDESGVNIDEELSNLVLVQTAFSASARAVSAIDELFQELLNAIA